MATHLPHPQLGSQDLGDRVLKVMCSPTDPFDQGVVATDEVKEEPPEPFQKIGPSMRGQGLGRGWVRDGGGAEFCLWRVAWCSKAMVPTCQLGKAASGH